MEKLKRRIIDNEFHQLVKIHKEFEERKIDSLQVLSLLDDIDPISIEQLKEKVLLKEMSLVKTIVDYLKDYKSVYDAHNGVAFEATMKPVYKMYLNHLATINMTSKEMPFSKFIKHILDTSKKSKEELKALNNDKLFWDFIDVAEVEIIDYFNYY